MRKIVPLLGHVLFGQRGCNIRVPIHRNFVWLAKLRFPNTFPTHWVEETFNQLEPEQGKLKKAEGEIKEKVGSAHKWKSRLAGRQNRSAPQIVKDCAHKDIAG